MEIKGKITIEIAQPIAFACMIEIDNTQDIHRQIERAIRAIEAMDEAHEPECDCGICKRME